MGGKLTIYHGSQKLIQQPVYGAGNVRNDYGLGFYCTENVDLAKEWACTEENSGYANCYQLDLGGLTILDLSDHRYHILNWLSLLLQNRVFKISNDLAAEGKEKQIVFLHYGLWAVNWVLYSLVAFLGILFGSDAVSTLMDAIPDVVMNGLTVCGGLLPAVGMAMLMKMLWDKKICMFYFLGFVLSAYMNLPLIAIAVIGVIVAISIGMNDYKINQLSMQRVAAPAGNQSSEFDEEEEEFFS